MCGDTPQVSAGFAAAFPGKDAIIINAEMTLIKREGVGEHTSDKLAEDDFLILRQVVWFETTCLEVPDEAAPSRKLIRALQKCGMTSLEDAASMYATVADVRDGLVHEGPHASSTFTDDSCILWQKARKILIKLGTALRQSTASTTASKPPGL